MPDISARLGLPYILPAQAQKHVTHNAALARLDALVQLTVQGFEAADPPPAPTEGDTTGAWAGQPARGLLGRGLELPRARRGLAGGAQRG